MSHWIYHPENEAKIVSSEEYEIYLKNGWFDTPAKFNQSKEESPNIEFNFNDGEEEKEIKELIDSARKANQERRGLK
jgi:hypothetical protein